MGVIIDTINDAMDSTVVRTLEYILNAVPESFKIYITLGIAILLITFYAIFVWKFYRFLAKREILELNLAQYNRSENPALQKLLALLFFMIEYIVILPIVTIFWFFVMAGILFLLAKDLPIETIMIISACIVSAVRITSYYNQNLSRDLAKMFPFTILAIALVTPGFFSIEPMLEKLANIGDLLTNVVGFLVVIMLIEFVLRMLHLLSSGTSDESKVN